MIIGIDASRANRKYKSGTEWYSYYLIKALARIDAANQYILYTDTALTGGLIDLTKDDNDGTSDKIIVSKSCWQEIKSPHNNFRAKIIRSPVSFFWTQFFLSKEMFFSQPDKLFIPAHALPVIHPRKSIVTLHDVGFAKDRRLYSDDKMGPANPRLQKIINWLVRLFTLNKYQAKIMDYNSWSVKFALRHAKKVITVSNFSKQEIIKYYGAKETQIEVVYNGYSGSLYKKIDDNHKIRRVLAGYGIEGPYIFYVGRLEKKKNTPTLISAYAIMKERYREIKHKLVLVGNASSGFDEVKYNIQEFNINDDVVLTGWVPERDMPYIYNGAAAFIFPSNYEGFGIPLLEAMACGTPIAASNAAAIPEIVGDAAVLFNPRDQYAMAESLAKIILDHDLRAELTQKGYVRVNNFSWEKCARQTLRILEES